MTSRPASQVPARLVALAVSLALVAGCSATMAPPMLSTHFGAPGRAPSGQTLVQVAMNNQLSGTGQVSIPVADDLHLELGADLRPHDESWAMGSAGVRYTVGPAKVDGRRPSTGPFGDVEAGLGAGVGGVKAEVEGQPVDTRSAWERFAFGGYLGAGFGYRFLPWIAGFARTRMQVTHADAIPTTTWFSAMGGPEFALGPVSLHLAGGWVGYENDTDSSHGPLFEAGLGMRF